METETQKRNYLVKVLQLIVRGNKIIKILPQSRLASCKHIQDILPQTVSFLSQAQSHSCANCNRIKIPQEKIRISLS